MNCLLGPRMKRNSSANSSKKNAERRVLEGPFTAESPPANGRRRFEGNREHEALSPVSYPGHAPSFSMVLRSQVLIVTVSA